jgi:hypothetical protein
MAEVDQTPGPGGKAVVAATADLNHKEFATKAEGGTMRKMLIAAGCLIAAMPLGWIAANMSASL